MTSTVYVRNYSFQFYIGGIAGSAQNSNNDYTDPGEEKRYSIENCFVLSDIDIYNIRSYYTRNYSYLARIQAGGIIGNINKQPVWPKNCLYSGAIDSYGFIGPIFGGLVQTETTSNNTNNFSAHWNGNQAGGNLSITSYYTNFTANGTSFTSSEISGTSTSYLSNQISNRSINGVKGVNKGIYLNDISSMLQNLNDGTSDVNWTYENGDLKLIERLTPNITQLETSKYKAQIVDKYNTWNYTYKWYKNGTIDTNYTNDIYETTPNYIEDQNITLIVKDGKYYGTINFVVQKLYIAIEFNVNKTNSSVVAKLTGTAKPYVNENTDYTYQWYKEDISGEGEPIEGETSLTLTNLEEGMDYRLVATNKNIPELNAENSFTFGDRTVIYVNYSEGNDYNDGYTPETAVRTMPTAYQKLNSNGNRNTNVIVVIGNYNTQDVFYNTQDSTNTNYQKQATITGKYKGINYSGSLQMYYSYGSSGWGWDYSYNYNFINADTTFQYLTFNGNNTHAYLYAQGHNLTMGKGIHMTNYSQANTNQGLISGNAPGFHVLGAYLQYNRTTLPRNNSKIIIKSGAYGRVLGGGGCGTSDYAGQQTSHDFTGSNLTDDTFKVTIEINIEESTKGNYAYDINLLGGGATAGNMYANATINIKNGEVGRVLGGSIGDRTYIRNWYYPENTYLGSSTINLTGGTVQELYGGSLGRNMSAIGSGDSSAANLTCDTYYYGNITINISENAIINSNIYGAGAGGVTGYNENSSDQYKSYGENIESTVNMNISGGQINGNIYGGGYGYTEYLTQNVTAQDGGALYGTSNINISGSPTIIGNVYGAGCGYNYSNKTQIAQMVGNSNIIIKETPNIQGKIFGAGAGISGYEQMAQLTGNTKVTIETDLNIEIYGGGNIAKTIGEPTINLQTGNHTESIYGGGNLGAVEGTSNININGGTQENVFGGGNEAKVTKTNVFCNNGTTTNTYAGGNKAEVEETNIYCNGGNSENVFGGGNQAGVIKTNIYCNGETITNVFGGSNADGTVNESNIEVNNGILENLYGGNNQGGTTQTSNILVKGGTIQNVYGGGDKAETITSNINTISGTMINIYGGGNQAGITTSNITTNGGNIQNIYGGSNKSGDVQESNVITNGSKEDLSFTIQNVYGGNNQGGETKTSNVTINEGGVYNVYGGGNQAITNETNVQINGEVKESVYGGGNQAGVNTNTNVKLTGATIHDNVYGGGNEGTVTGDTFVYVKNSKLMNSVYAGGNGSTATVFQNTNLYIEGTTTEITNSAFGGGNKAQTGDEENNNSISTVNIVGGKIGKNVYGGANTSVVYGITKTNIGYDTVQDTTLEKGNIEIEGTVFGGGEANESGSEIYDFSFISVTKGIDIQINGNGHEKYSIKGSIFGSGNASSTSGESNITINNYGTKDSPKSNVSIQRTDCATIINSAISLSGATDRTNEYSSVFFSLSRVSKVKLKNNSTLYLCNGANLLKELCSLVDVDGNEQKGTVTIDQETGDTVKNVDNRIYMLEGKNLNIATNEQVTAYGKVQGMFFFGLFTNRNNPSTSTGFYHEGYNNGDTITNQGTFILNSYAMAQHMENHDTTVDGFYTNYNKEGIIRTNYIETTPKDDVYYIWLVGEKMDVTVFDVSLTASKYATLGTYELLLKGFSDPNIKFTISGFSSGLTNGISLVNPNEIKSIEQDEEKANSLYGLSMKTGNMGWTTKGETTFLTENGGKYVGTNDYQGDNSNYTPTLNLCLYHSQNITLKQALGDVKIRLQVLTPIDDLNYKMSYIDINITLTSALYQNDFYEAAITPGQEFGLFTTTETTITDKSAFSAYYSLYIDKFSESDYYEKYKNLSRVLVSRDVNDNPYCFPQNTKITMLDMRTNKYYYYIVSNMDVTNNKYIYSLKDFIAMGSDDSYFNEQMACDEYLDMEKNLIYENFIFHVNFADSNVPNNIENNSLLMELRDQEEQTLIGVLGIQRDTMRYTVYKEKSATIKLDGNLDPETLYLGKTLKLNVTTDFTQTIVNSKTVYDTQYFDKKLGIKISIYDNNGNRLNNDSLLGVNFELDGKLYYPRIDGTTRINIAEKVTDVLAKIKMNTQNNTTLATGDYKIKIESFGSSDGIYYGLTASDQIELDVRIINSSYGLKVTTDDECKIVNKDTSLNKRGNDTLVSKIEYSSGLANPNIRVALYRRDYSEIYSQKYELVDLREFIRDYIIETTTKKEYLVTSAPKSEINFQAKMKENLKSGTYKLVFKLYDDDAFVGEAYDYIVIK